MQAVWLAAPLHWKGSIDSLGEWNKTHYMQDTFDHGKRLKPWARGLAERISGEISNSVRRKSADLSANFDSQIFPQIFRPCFPGLQAPWKNSRPEFTPTNRRHSSSISLSRTQMFFKAIFCLRARPFHWVFWIFSVDFSFFSPGFLCNLVRKSPQNLETIACCLGRAKCVKCCCVSGCSVSWSQYMQYAFCWSLLPDHTYAADLHNDHNHVCKGYILCTQTLGFSAPRHCEVTKSFLNCLGYFQVLFRCFVFWPTFSQELCWKTHIVGANLKRGGEDFHWKGGKTQQRGR